MASDMARGRWRTSRQARQKAGKAINDAEAPESCISDVFITKCNGDQPPYRRTGGEEKGGLRSDGSASRPQNAVWRNLVVMLAKVSSVNEESYHVMA